MLAFVAIQLFLSASNKEQNMLAARDSKEVDLTLARLTRIGKEVHQCLWQLRDIGVCSIKA